MNEILLAVLAFGGPLSVLFVGFSLFCLFILVLLLPVFIYNIRNNIGQLLRIAKSNQRQTETMLDYLATIAANTLVPGKKKNLLPEDIVTRPD